MDELTQSLLDIPINRKLPRRQRSHHEQSCSDPGIAPPQPQILRDLDQPAGGALSWESLGLVDLAEHGVGGLGDDGGGEPGDEAGAEIDKCLHAVGGFGLIDALVDCFGNFFVDDEFGHCVGDSIEWVLSQSVLSLAHTGKDKSQSLGMHVLFEQDRSETRVERSNPFILCYFPKSGQETGCKGRF